MQTFLSHIFLNRIIKYVKLSFTELFIILHKIWNINYYHNLHDKYVWKIISKNIFWSLKLII